MKYRAHNLHLLDDAPTRTPIHRSHKVVADMLTTNTLAGYKLARTYNVVQKRRK